MSQHEHMEVKLINLMLDNHTHQYIYNIFTILGKKIKISIFLNCIYSVISLIFATKFLMHVLDEPLVKKLTLTLCHSGNFYGTLPWKKIFFLNIHNDVLATLSTFIIFL